MDYLAKIYAIKESDLFILLASREKQNACFSRVFNTLFDFVSSRLGQLENTTPTFMLVLILPFLFQFHNEHERKKEVICHCDISCNVHSLLTDVQSAIFVRVNVETNENNEASKNNSNCDNDDYYIYHIKHHSMTNAHLAFAAFRGKTFILSHWG